MAATLLSSQRTFFRVRSKSSSLLTVFILASLQMCLAGGKNPNPLRKKMLNVGGAGWLWGWGGVLRQEVG